MPADDLALPDMPLEEDPLAATDAMHPPASGRLPSDELMKLRIGTGDIPPNELMESLEASIPLPDNAIDHLGYQAKLDLIEVLANQGIDVDLSAPDPITGTNFLGNYVRNVGYSRFTYTEEQIADSIDRLIALGVTVDDGFRQALATVRTRPSLLI